MKVETSGGSPALRKYPSAAKTEIDISNEVERQFLGSLINWPELLGSAIGVSEESFVAPHHACIWEALVTLFADSSPPDLVSLCKRIDGAGHAKRFKLIGGLESYLSELPLCVDTMERFPELVRALRGEQARRKLGMSRPRKDEQADRSRNQTADLMDIFRAQEGEVFRSHDDRPLVCLTDKARRTVSLPQALRLLCLAYYRRTGQAVGARSKEELQSLLSAMADDGEKRPTWIRVGEHGGDIYLDLGDETWTAIRITAHGWEPVTRCPVHFLRPASLQPLPMPERGGMVEELFSLCNITERQSQSLALSWLVAACRPGRPVPLLAVTGKQGSAKSTTAEMLSRIIDPKITALRTKPKDEETVMVSAHNSWVIGYDNLSGIPDWLSDFLCSLSTGVAHTGRALYTNGEESVMQAIRPIILTSIDDVAKRSDLIDRTLILSLPTLEEEQRRTEEEVWADFDEAHPRILGAVLDAVSSAIAKLPSIPKRNLPRMADFARWAMAAEEALGFNPGEFRSAYADNRLDGHAQALENCPLVEPIDRFMSNKNEWTGTATDLLRNLEERATKQEREHRRWPKDAIRLSGELQRVAPNLRFGGIDFRQSREPTLGRRRVITLQKLGDIYGEHLQPGHQRQAQLVD